jgi:endonuclease/exonuclease/phosphatase family metal-dependent hydrolase
VSNVPPSVKPTDVVQLTVASYNIHGCRGLDCRVDADRVVRVIRAFDTDIVALQEVAIQRGKSDNLSQLNYIAEATGFAGTPGPALLHPDAPCGTALLTRHHRILAIRHLDLSMPKREPRGALDVDLEVEGMVFRIISTHLGLRAWERREQVARLLAALSATNGDLVMLTGDINEWFPLRRTLHLLHTFFGKGSAPATFPSFFPILTLDRLWVKKQPNVLKTAIEVYKTPLARIASDHLPLLAKITVNKTQAKISLAEETLR